MAHEQNAQPPEYGGHKAFGLRSCLLRMKSSLAQFANRLRHGTLARNSGWMFLGFGLRIVVQAGYFIFIARALGPHEYGEFVGVTALISIIAPFVSVGAGNLLIKNVARDRKVFNEYWGNALVMSFVSGTLLLALVLSVVRFILPHSIPWTLIVLICCSDLLMLKCTEIAAQGFQAADDLRYTAQLSLLPYILRLVGAAILFFVWHRATALRWGWFYLASTFISSVVALIVTNRKLGKPRVAIGRVRRELLEGFYFGASLSAQTIYNDIDKTMLARLSTLDATGIYAAAYRLIDVSFAPVRSVLYATYTNFFREGERGLISSYAYARRVLPKMIGYSLFVFVALFVTAPIVPLVLGSEYSGAVEALRWLALLPLFKSMHYFLADSLTGAGYQGTRTAMQITVAVANIILNLWLIPAYSWRGAAWASLASDGMLVVLMYTAVTVMLAKQGRPAPDAPQVQS